MAQKYTDEQKAAVLARAAETDIRTAAGEAGIPWKKVAKWNKAASAQADETADTAKEKEEKVKKKAAKAAKKARAAKTELIFESDNGLQITLKELKDRLPKGCDAAYIKPGENRIYWVKGEENGFVDIW